MVKADYNYYFNYLPEGVMHLDLYMYDDNNIIVMIFAIVLI